ncbi:group III truncated hemoglobin [Mucilaginibacter rubeus]|uniref:Group III truncated hemoglobin n=1 Tax=Mucilaginibacter rubeus TaxID=2027860 RepID=A0A5C1HTZ4_9SPHI|nr:group III truncated hemoglobin [Mucilaginibacter rubeus]QEM09009.1 group III truncated hemoglobin [Mucilaginibacter rubeus]
MNDIEDITSIKLMVDEFYSRVRLDGLLGPVFAGVIKDDWQPHLDKMYAFWNAALFGVPGFKGNPFARHAPLPIGNAHFDRWLELFTQTVDAHFAGPMADDAKNRAGLMAAMFMSKLANMKGGAGRVIM